MSIDYTNTIDKKFFISTDRELDEAISQLPPPLRGGGLS